MGRSKAELLFGKETLLARTVRVVGEVVRPLLVVGAAEQEIPLLSEGVRVGRDRQFDRGPMEGVAAGLHAIATDCEAAFVASWDLPFCQRRVLGFLCDSLRPCDAAVVARIGGAPYPLAAVYRAMAAPMLDERIARGELSLRKFLDEISTVFVEEAAIRRVDPDLSSFVNVNTPDEYQAAIARLSEKAE